MYTAATFAITLMMCAALTYATNTPIHLDAQELDHPYVVARTHGTFFASQPQHVDSCGWLQSTFELVCFYCVDEACDRLSRDDTMLVNYATDASDCVNQMTILTRPKMGGECGMMKTAMILMEDIVL